MAEDAKKEQTREEIRERIADVLEGSVPERLLEFVAEDDEARDFVYDAERVVEVTQRAAADYSFDGEAVERRLMEALDEREVEEEDAEPKSGTPSSKRDRKGEARPSSRRGAKRKAVPTDDAVDPRSWSLGERLGRKGRLWVVVGAAVAVAAAAVLVLRSGGSEGADGGWGGRVQHVSRAFGGGQGLERCSPEADLCARVDAGDEVAAGSVLRTDGQSRAVIELDDGSRIILDRDTEVALSAEKTRRAELRRGGLLADVAEDRDPQAVIDVPLGRAEVVGTKFALRALPGRVTVDVSRGAVRLVDGLERSVIVYAGEEGHIYPDEPPTATAAPALGDAFGWGETTFSDDKDADAVLPGLGELKAKKPGEDHERSGAVTLSTHQVRVRISGAVARTEVEEVFTNTTDEVLEGIYRFPMPPDAQIERLALEVDGRMLDGAFVERDRAAAIWRGAIVNSAKEKPKVMEEIVWVPGPWRDPALLEWQRGGRFELRIFPIPKRGSRRIVLAYTQTIRPSGGLRRYTYPLPQDPSGSTRVGRFDVDVQVRGHDKDAGVKTYGYTLRSAPGDAPDVARMSMSENGFVPRGDFTLEYSLPGRNTELTAWAYRPEGKAEAPASGSPTGGVALASVGGSEMPYVALALRPKLPRWTDRQHRSFAVVVDASRSMVGERYRRASRLAERLVAEMDHKDRVTVLACDTICREAPGGLGAPGRERAAEVGRFLGGITPEGGSDLAGSVRQARDAARRDGADLRVVYIGDGTPTVGPTEPAFLRREVSRTLAGSSGLTAVAIGADADMSALEAVAQAGGGVVLPYVPGQRVSDATYAVLGVAYGNALRDAEVTLPDGLVDVAPARVGTIVAGSETYIFARMQRPTVQGTVRLRGKVGAQPFEQSYPIKVEATTAKGNAFVPRMYAAAKIAELEKDPAASSRERAVELSKRFSVASRYTSLLVLESEAMFRAFGLDNRRTAELWTGEEEAEGTEAEGEVDYAKDKDEESFADGALGGGFASGGGRTAAAPRRSAPTKKANKSSMEGPSPPASRPRPETKAAESSAEAAAPAARAPLSDRDDVVLAPAPAPTGISGAPSDLTLTMRWAEQQERRRMIPMRRIWERVGKIVEGVVVPKAASSEAIAEAERAVEANKLDRRAVHRLFTLYMLAGRLDDASRIAEEWSAKDPLDPDALTARADVAAARGERDLAIRILGSVVDVRPGDHKAQWRLARLHRWAGRLALGCRHSLAVSQIRSGDAKLLAEAVRCARDVGDGALADDLLAAAHHGTREGAHRVLGEARPDVDTLSGDLKLEATWDGGADVDLALIHPDGHRVSWLGAPTQSVITARDVQSPSTEGLGLRGAKPGEYILELTRASREGSARGNIRVTAGKTTATVPFAIDSERTRIALIRITTVPKLVPL